MTVSIALATYNGAPFIAEQLESFCTQTVLPEELIIVDDCSTDKTVQIIREFQKSAPFPIKLHVNDHNIGLTLNFEKAISLCSSDIILLSDQDDVWLPLKITTYKQYFEQHPTCNLLFSNATIVSENLAELGYSYWDACAFTKKDVASFPNKALTYLTRWCYSPGMTIGLRKAKLPDLLPFPIQLEDFVEFMHHDDYLPFAMEVLFPGSVHLLNESYILYRQHLQQKSGSRHFGFSHALKKKISKIIRFKRHQQQKNRSEKFHKELILLLKLKTDTENL